MNAIAYLSVRIEIACKSTWEVDCTLAQVRKQAKEEALNALLREINDVPGIKLLDKDKVKIVISDE
jgi:hypothetical protein